jgi:DNA-binding LacI/PurR family transcriptional regulator
LDDGKVAYDATSHLISLGHSKIAMITGPLEEDCSCDRVEGFRAALKEAGLVLDESMILEGDWTATSGQEGLHILVKSGKTPTAVFAQNDRMAMGVLRAARELNLSVPEDLAVIGVDDMPLASYFDPPLTTMHQDMPLIGQEATKVLMDLIHSNKKRQCHLKIPAHLVVRQSTVTDSLKGGN